MNERGQYGSAVGRITLGPRGRGPAFVGARPLYSHPLWGGAPAYAAYGWPYPGAMIGVTPAALKDELERLNDEIRALEQQLQVQTVALTSDRSIKQSPLYNFYTKRWTPFRNKWRDFYSSTRLIPAGGPKLFTVEAQIASWGRTFIDMRAAAGVAGFNIQRPSETPSSSTPAEPAPFPVEPTAPVSPGPTVQAPGPAAAPADDKGTGYGLYVALGIGAIAVTALAITASRSAL